MRRKTRELTIVAISDSHELHREINVPHGDILIHAGDWTMFGRSKSAIEDFDCWLGELPHRHKIVIRGNHESRLQVKGEGQRLLKNATVLDYESVTVEGLEVFGGSFYPSFPNGQPLTMPFCDVLISHVPAFGFLDMPPASSDHLGDKGLTEAINRTRPRLVISGHAHGAHGTMQSEHSLFVNAALMGLEGELAFQPIVIKMLSSELDRVIVQMRMKRLRAKVRRENSFAGGDSFDQSE